MSSFYDLASLVVVPSGYHSGKIYAQKPLSTDGELTFSRATSATRVGPDGLIQRVLTNNLPYSEAFDNAAWIKQEGASVVANVAANPLDGALTADRLIIPTTANSRIEQVPPTGWATSGQLITLSCYIKGFSGSGIVGMRSGIVGDSTLWSFNPSTWTRVTWTKTAGSNYEIPQFCNGTLVAGADASVDILAFGFQIELGDIATDYIATTSAAVSVGMLANTPRLDYSGGATCPKLLLEGQRTNLALQSDSVTTSTTNVGYTATSNAATSPDGYASADQILEDTSTLHLVQKEFSVGSTTDTYAVSFFVKANGRTSGRIVYGLNAPPYSSVSADFNLTAGTITAADASAGATAGTSKIENYGNDWYRVSVTGVIGTAGTHYVRLQDTNGGVAGDVTKGFFVWGFQAELGSYLTSMVSTLGAAVTRGADSAYKTGISSLIGQTEGTLFFDLNTIANGQFKRLSINNGAFTNSIFFDFDNANQLYAKVINAGVVTHTLLSNVSIPNTQKIAFAYKANDFAFYVNGNLVASSASGTVPSGLTAYQFSLAGNQLFEGTINQALLFKTRLSNADLATLTTI